MPRGNQHKPLREQIFCEGKIISANLQIATLAPLDDLRPYILKYWMQRKTDDAILRELKKKHIDLNKYGLG